MHSLTGMRLTRQPGFHMQAKYPPQQQHQFFHAALLESQQQQQRQQAAPVASTPVGASGGSSAAPAAPTTIGQGVALEVTQSEVQAYQACYAQLQQQQQHEQRRKQPQAPPEGNVPLPIVQVSSAPAPSPQPRVPDNHAAMEPAAQVSLLPPSQTQPQARPPIVLPPPSIVLPPGPGQVQLVQQGRSLVHAPTAGTGAAAQAVQQHVAGEQKSPVQQRRAVGNPARGTPLLQRSAITTPTAVRSNPGHATQLDAVDTILRQTPQQPGVELAPAQLPASSEPPMPSLRVDSVAPAVLQHVAAGINEPGHPGSPVRTTVPAGQLVASPQRRRTVSSAAAEQDWADVKARKATPVGSPRYLNALCIHLRVVIYAHAETPTLFQR